MFVTKRMAAGLVVSTAMTFAAGAAAAGGIVTWSYAQVGVGSCDAATCNAAHPAVYIAKPIDQGFDHNSSVTYSDATRGSASASVGIDDFPALPELHAIASGKPDAAGAKSWNFAFVEAAVGFRWTGADLSVPRDTFVGTLDWSNTGTFFGYANGSMAVTDNSIENPAVGALWSADNGTGGFAATCSTQGAESILTTGVINTKGFNQTAVTNPLCAMPTINLVHGQDFYFYSRLETFIFGNEVSDASGTFTIDFKEGTSPTLQRYIASHVAPVGSAPEPAGWALMLLGFGVLGAGLRSQRKALAV